MPKRRNVLSLTSTVLTQAYLALYLQLIPLPSIIQNEIVPVVRHPLPLVPFSISPSSPGPPPLPTPPLCAIAKSDKLLMILALRPYNSFPFGLSSLSVPTFSSASAGAS